MTMYITVPAGQSVGKFQRTNGWWAYYKNTSRSNVPYPGETREQARLRVWNACKEIWRSQGPEGDELRRYWRQQALDQNQQAREHGMVPAGIPAGAAEPQQQLATGGSEQPRKLLASLKVARGSGILGLGDTKFAMSVEAVRDADSSQPSFEDLCREMAPEKFPGDRGQA